MRYLQQNTNNSTINLDKKDKKILSALSQDARQSYTQIAKKVGLSHDAVRYRIKKYNESGLIQGFTTIINQQNRGLISYHVFIRLRPPTLEVEKQFVSSIQHNPHINAIIRYDGSFDFEIAVLARNNEEFETILTQIVTKNRQIQDFEVVTLTQILTQRVFPLDFIESKDENHSHITKQEQKIQRDEKDEEILQLLGKDASLPYHTISQKVGLSADTIVYRVKKMKKSGLIKKFVPIINYAALNYSIYALRLQVVNSGRKNLKEVVETDPNIIWGAQCIGPYNVILYLCVIHANQLHETITRIRSHIAEDVKKFDLAIAFEEYKYTYL